MLGYSEDVKTHLVEGKKRLDDWMSKNDVKILDIKFSYDSNYKPSETFLIIYSTTP